MKLKETIISAALHFFPDTQQRLVQADIKKTKEQFVKQALFSSLYLTFFLDVLLFLFLHKQPFFLPLVLLLTPLLYFFLFVYFMQYPNVKRQRLERLIEQEIVYAGRFLIIELQSGVSLYDSFVNVSITYPRVGDVFRKIIQSVDLGSPLEDALEEGIESCPSEHLRRMLLQIKNSLRSGSDITNSLVETTRQITEEQVIAVKEYGRKLNPFVMFFMMVAVILPSLGATALIVLASFMNIAIDLTILLVLVGLLAFIQFMFLNLIKSSRPPVDYD